MGWEWLVLPMRLSAKVRTNVALFLSRYLAIDEGFDIKGRMRSKAMDNQRSYLAALFFVIALVAGLIGFTGLAGASANTAQSLFGLFFVLFVAVLFFRGPRSMA